MRPLTPGLPPAVVDATTHHSAAALEPPADPNLVRAEEVAGARRVGRNTLEILLFRGVSTPVALLMVVLQSRFLHPEGRGVYVVVVLSATIVSRLLGQLGVAVTNHMSDAAFDEAHELRPLVHRAFALGASLALLGGAVIVAWGTQSDAVGPTLALLAVAGLVPNVIWQTQSGVLLGLARIRVWNYIQLLPPVLTLAGLCVFVVLLDGEVGAALVAWALANALTAVFALAATRELWLPADVPRLGDERSRVILRLALAMGGMQVVALIAYRASLVVLERLRDLETVGVYSIAMQAVEAMWLISAAMATAITAPVVREMESGAVRLVRRTALRSLVYTGAVAAAVAGAAPFVIPAVFGEAFSGASRPLALLVPGVVAYAPVAVLVVYLSVRRGRPRLSLAVSLAALAVTLVASVPLVDRYGASGAACASSLGYLAGGALAWLAFLRMTRSAGTASRERA